MQLVHMDVDQSDTKERFALGPFSPGLNAICGPRGSGKTTLLNWLRQVTAEDYGYAFARPNSPHHYTSVVNAGDSLERLSGRLDVRNRGAIFDVASGRASGANSVVGNYNYRQPANSLSPAQRDVFSALAAASGSADTEAALAEIARRMQIDNQAGTDHADERRRLLDHEQDLLSRTAHYAGLRADREELLKRRSELEVELGSIQRRGHSHGLRREESRTVENRRLLDRVDAVEVDLRNTLGEIEQLDGQIATLRAELKLHETGHHAFDVGESYRSQLQQLDDRLNRWRQTLRDLKAHRERIEHNATDARLDKQIGEQLSSSKDSDPRAALRSLEAQIASTRAQLDQLVISYSSNALPQAQPGGQARQDASNGYAVHRDARGQTRISYTEAYAIAGEPSALLETLRVMQRDLHEVCQQLARHEASTAAETLKQQSQQLVRCESELLQSVEKLIEERADLLRRIAAEQHLSVEQLTLAFGEWCQCHDHPHLHDWLLKNESVNTATRYQDSAARQSAMDELERLEARRKQENLRAEECRRQIRDAELLRRGSILPVAETAGRLEADVARDLHMLTVELNDLDDRDRLGSELEQVRLQLSRLPLTERQESSFQKAVDRHIVGLMGPRASHSLDNSYSRRVPYDTDRRYDSVDGVIIEQPSFRAEYDVPSAIVRAAMRLAIVDAMGVRGEPVALILDGSLDQLAPSIQKAAVGYLASATTNQQQIVVLTGDEQIATLVRNHRGYVGYLSSIRRESLSSDINRQLAAYANDVEADKWYHPTRSNPPRESSRGEYYLNDRSKLDDLPSVPSDAVARCRQLGIARVGDLLDVDPQWLAENLRLEGTPVATIVRWQSEARLLCSVRKLRPFDARVLVGAGIRTPQQLSEMAPSSLLDRVERFLATDQGRSILRSGSRFELSRITAWIASAEHGSNRYQRSSLLDNRGEGFDTEHNGNGEEYGYEFDRSPNYSHSASGNGASRNSSHRNGERLSGTSKPRTGDGERGSSSQERSVRPRSARDSRGERRPRSERDPRERTRRTESRDDRQARPARVDSVRLAKTYQEAESDVRLKFFLELSSPVVDAPSIGPRMAGKLEEFGIITVDQLLAANADSLADKLNMRRVEASTVLAWQEQARLVCRIPNLRGHDAQMLVACDMTSPEALATMNPATVLADVLAFARTVDGQRVLRGSKEPDIEEVSDWISWAGCCRNLAA